MTDAELVRAAAGGSEFAFRQLYQAYVRPVYWIAHGLLSSSVDAEDVTQETFVVAWRKLQGLELQGESLLPWLATICRFQASNRLRTRRRERQHAGELIDEAVPSTINVEEQVITEDLAAKITATVQGMSEIDQEIFRLCTVEGYAYQAAADELGVAHGVVRNRLSRIRTKLRTTLSDSEAT